MQYITQEMDEQAREEFFRVKKVIFCWGSNIPSKLCKNSSYGIIFVIPCCWGAVCVHQRELTHCCA